MLKRGFKAEAERTALFYRKLLELNERDPMPARQLAAYLDISLITPYDIPGMDDKTLDALLITGKGRWSAGIFQRDEDQFIIYNPTHAPTRQESDLMHEIAHSLCGHELKTMQTAIMGCIIPLRKYDKVQEDEAEWLGGCLQLPQKALFHYYKVKKMTASDISKLFTASEQMVNYRLRKTGLTKLNWDPS